jgi:predicted ATPase
MASGIAVFVSVRFNEALPKDVSCVIGKRLVQDGGCAIPCPGGIGLAATFGGISATLSFVRQLHTLLAKHGKDSATPLQACVGIECGEYPPPPTKRIEPLERCAELAKLGSLGQNLIGTAAREIARPLLPPGYMMVDLGEIRLGNSISADRVCQLSISGFPDDFPYIDALDDVESNITPIERPIGRDREISQLTNLLQESQIVTVVGPAGVGKSTLAHYVADTEAVRYRDGSWKVDLAKIPANGNVATAIAADLKLPALQGASAEERVKFSLATMIGIVWLDNCEHVLTGTTKLLLNLIGVCPNVIFLLTSRIRLRIGQELVFELRPFDVPENPDDFAELEAVKLFLRRAKSADPQFFFSPADLAIIAEICRRLDGLPLAIELAAAQVGKQSLPDLLRDLSKAMISHSHSPRHRTLDGALYWSYSLLSDKEQKFFRTLGVLSGPTNRSLAIGLGSLPKLEDLENGQLLDSLVTASLVQENRLRGARSYRLLQPLRQFAQNQLEKNEELTSAKTKLAKAFTSWLDNLRVTGILGNRWVNLVDRERANLEAVLDWLLDNGRGGRDALILCVELYDYWILKGPYEGAFNWYKRALVAGKSTPAADLGDIYNWMGLFAAYAGDYKESKAAFYESIRLHKKAGKPSRQAVAMSNLSIPLRNNAEIELALETSLQALALTPLDDSNISMRTSNVSSHLIDLERYADARPYLEQAMDLNKEVDAPWPRACQHSQLTYLALSENDTSKAELHLGIALEAYKECGNVQGLLATIELAAFVALRIGDFGRAAKLMGGTERHFIAAGVGRPPLDLKKRNDGLSTIEDALGKEVAEAFYAAGAMMSINDLFDYSRSRFLD